MVNIYIINVRGHSLDTSFFTYSYVFTWFCSTWSMCEAADFSTLNPKPYTIFVSGHEPRARPATEGAARRWNRGPPPRLPRRYIYKHTYTHTHMHTYTHTYTHTL